MMRASAGTCTSPRLPTAVMRLFVTTTSASSITSAPFIVTTRPPRRTALALGRSRVTEIEILFSIGL
jgi:hypothetical protein